jgi:hypothetical protein
MCAHGAFLFKDPWLKYSSPIFISAVDKQSLASEKPVWIYNPRRISFTLVCRLKEKTSFYELRVINRLTRSTVFPPPIARARASSTLTPDVVAAEVKNF